MGVLRWVLEKGVEPGRLARRSVELRERVPARIGHRWAITWCSVEVGPAARTQPFAILATESEARSGQEPELPDRRPEIELGRARVYSIDVGIVGFLVLVFRVDEVCFVAHVSACISETTAAW